jgi:hypothetical protein
MTCRCEFEHGNESRRNDFVAQECADCWEGLGRWRRTTQEEIQNYEAKMKELAEFTEQKGALESEMTDLRELLDSERRSHEELIADLERKAVQEKDRLKKEMVCVSPCSPQSCERWLSAVCKVVRDDSLTKNHQARWL